MARAMARDDARTVGVLGPGGVGGLIAARLAHAGHDVTVVATERTAAAIAVHGLTLRAPDGELATRPRAGAWLPDPVDVLFVAVKANDLLPSLERVPAEALRRATIVPLLNGIDHVALLRARYPESGVVAATIAVEATRHRPGEIEQLSSFSIVEVAAPPELTATAESVADLLDVPGIDVSTNADEPFVLWRKLAVLAPMALLTTAANAPLGPACEAHPDWVSPLVAEVAAAARASGAAIDAEPVERRLRKVHSTMKTSMLKDREAGRALELDAIAGPTLRALSADGAPVTAAAVSAILEALD
jgi:2-dehydropantoate 2-reductase